MGGPVGESVFTVFMHAGLFEQHKLLFSFSMTIKIQEVEESLNRDELDFFIKVKTSLLCTCVPYECGNNKDMLRVKVPLQSVEDCAVYC